MHAHTRAPSGTERSDRLYHSPPPAETKPCPRASTHERVIESPNDTYQSLPFHGSFCRVDLPPGGPGSPGPTGGKSTRQKEPWNGRDWYVSFGDSITRSWVDARGHGFVSAGGGEWYSRSLRSVPEGARVWACIPKLGYVGVGVVTGPARPFTESDLASRGDLSASYAHPNGEAEWLLPVEWLATVPKQQAVWHKGMFANQNSATRLRNSFTLDLLHTAFPGTDVEST